MSHNDKQIRLAKEILEKAGYRVREGIWAYQTYQKYDSTNSKPTKLTLTYGQRVLAEYDKTKGTLTLGSEWKSHVSEVVEWILKYYPGFFMKQDSGSFYRFTPTEEEAIQYIKDKRVPIR